MKHADSYSVEHLALTLSEGWQNWDIFHRAEMMLCDLTDGMSEVLPGV
jgi:hypothetical protein